MSLLFFIVMLNPFVMFTLFAVVYGLLIGLNFFYMYKENEAVVFDVEEDTKIRQGKTHGLRFTTFFKAKSRVSRSE